MDVDALADRISEQLATIHRGAVLIGDGEFALFGNDDYDAPGVRRMVRRLRGVLIRRGLSPSPTGLPPDRSAWVIVVQPTATTLIPEAVRQRLDSLVWLAWKKCPNEGRTAVGAADYQRSHAGREIAAFGGGYTDATLTTPLAGKGGRVRGSLLVNEWALQSSEGGEDVHVVLGGIPYPTRMLPADKTPRRAFKDAAGEWQETDGGDQIAVFQETVGDPRSESRSPDDVYLSRGAMMPVTDTGEVHPSTGRRLLAPVLRPTGDGPAV